MDEIYVTRMSGKEILRFLDKFCTLFVNVVRADNPAPYVNALNRESIRPYWVKMAHSVFDSDSKIIVAFVGGGIFGAVKYRVDERQGILWRGEIEKFLVDSRFRREQVTAALLREVDKEVRITGTRADAPARRTGKDFDVPCDPGICEVPPLTPGVGHAGNWILTGRPGFRIKDEIAVVPSKKLDLSKDFYRCKLGLRLLSFRHLGEFFDTGGGILLLRAVDEVHPLPWPIAEWCVSNLHYAVIEMRSRNVNIVPNGIYREDRFGIFPHPDGGMGVIIRDPDGNLLALREPAMKSH
jgi:hypothetical protein